MPDTDESFIREAIKKSVHDDIEKRVYDKIRKDIFALRFFGTFGVALATLLVMFHQPIFGFIVRHGGEAFKDEVKTYISAFNDEVKTYIDNERIEWHKNIAEVNIRRDLFKEEIQTTKKQIDQHYDNIDKAKAEIEKLRASIEHESKKLFAALDSIKETAAVITERTAAAQSTASQAADRLEQVVASVKSLSKNQNTIVTQLAAGRPVVAQETAPVKQPAEYQKKQTVYFQFAGFSRDQASKIAAALPSDKWDIPGLERTQAAIDTNLIRYNPSDKRLADQLKQDTDAALKSLGLTITMSLEENSRVKPGIPEIWVYQR